MQLRLELNRPTPISTGVFIHLNGIVKGGTFMKDWCMKYPNYLIGAIFITMWGITSIVGAFHIEHEGCNGIICIELAK